MKRIIVNLYISAFLFVGFSCSNEIPTEESNIILEGIVAELGERTANTSESRATTDFAVNTSIDPTYERTRITGGFNWTLSVNIHDKNNADYPPGNGLCIFNVTTWIPQTPMFFPNYRSPEVLATLYPTGWVPGTSIATDQSDNTKLLNQDILVQNGFQYIIRPAHIPTIVLRHGHSMLNFILADVNSTEIVEVDVVAGGLTYQPYPVPGRTAPEYMVILPLGTINPVVRITTAAGARYQETINIPNANGTTINTCYCVKLIGVELILSSVTVIDWVYGTALAGSYTTITSYPTFRGNPNTQATLTYRSNQTQVLTFNQNGEAPGVKPLGRTIIQINGNTLSTPLILDKMYIDLRDYL